MLALTIAWSIEVGFEAPELRLEAGRALVAGALGGLEPGAPALPVLVRRLGLPEGAMVERVELIDAKYELVSDSFPVKTLGMPRIPGVPTPRVPEFRFKGRWPESPVRLAYQGFSRGKGVAFLLFFPAASDGKRLWRVKEARVRLVLKPVPAPEYSEPGFDILLLTSRKLAPAFEELIRWRQLQGYRVKLLTLDEVEAWPGADLPERIRNAIRYYAQEWGVRFVLLGGDKTVIPYRIAYQPIGYPQYGDSVATDLYYACLDGSWDPNGDGLWGTYPEEIDLLPDVAVARLPVRQPEEVLRYTRKLKAYEMGQGVHARALVHAADLFTTGDGAWYGRRVAQVLSVTYQVDSFYEAQLDHDITAGELLGKMAGAAVHFTISHGVWTRLLIDKSSGNSLTREEALEAEGTPTFSAVVACFGNSPEASVGRALVLAPEGGSVGLFGSGKLDFADYGTLIADSIFISLRDDPRAGAAYAEGLGKLAGLAGCTKVWRHLFFAYNLLGDPALRVWTSEPEDAYVDAPAFFSRELVVKTEPGAVVSLRAGSQVWSARADEAGVARIEGIDAEGEAELWVFAPGKRPYFRRIRGINGAQRLEARILSPKIPCPLDTCQVAAEVRNSGSLPARNISASLTLFGSAKPVGGATHLYVESLEPGEAETLRVSAAFEPGKAGAAVRASWNGGSVVDSALWDVKEPQLKFLGAKPEPKGLVLYIANWGKGAAKRVWVKAGNLVSLAGEILPGEIEKAFVPVSPPVQISVGAGPKVYESLTLPELNPPPTPESLRVQAVPGGARLEWEPVGDAYIVLKDGVPFAYTKHAQFTYRGSEPAKLSVLAVKEGAAGEPSPAITASPGPGFGPFQPVYREEFKGSAPALGELDPSSKGEELVLAGNGWVEVLAGNGRSLARWQEPGVLGLAPAIGDADGDGTFEIWLATADGVVVRDAAGRLLARYSLPAQPIQPVLLWDVDRDGAPEGLVKAQNSRLYLLDDGEAIDLGLTHPGAPAAVAQWRGGFAVVDLKRDTIRALDGSVKVTLGLPIPRAELAAWDSLVFVAVESGGTWFGVLDLAAGTWALEPRKISDKRYPKLVLGDASGDGTPEALIVAQDSVYLVDASGMVLAKAQAPFGYAVDAGRGFLLGTGDGFVLALPQLPGYPLQVNLNGASRSPLGFSAPLALGDLDGDGTLELVTPGTDGLVYSFNAELSSGWRGPRANRWNTGSWHAKLGDEPKAKLAKREKGFVQTLTRGELVLSVPGKSRVRYSVYDAAGRRAAAGWAEARSGTARISLARLPSGAYLLSVEGRLIKVVKLR